MVAIVHACLITGNPFVHPQHPERLPHMPLYGAQQLIRKCPAADILFICRPEPWDVKSAGLERAVISSMGSDWIIY